MNILARYIHGSADSADLDVLYIVDKAPALAECTAFCNGDPAENRNLAVVTEGVITWCFKGFPDELNNAILATWPLHEQADALLVRRTVPRDGLLKQLSVLRKLLMELRHTDLRRQARAALRGGYGPRMALLRATDFSALNWEIPEAERLERAKCMAFQLGQALALNDGVELYTKAAIAGHMPALRPFLYRQPWGMEPLEAARRRFIEGLEAWEIEDCGERTVRCRRGGPWRLICLRGKEHEVNGV